MSTGIIKTNGAWERAELPPDPADPAYLDWLCRDDDRDEIFDATITLDGVTYSVREHHISIDASAFQEAVADLRRRFPPIEPAKFTRLDTTP